MTKITVENIDILRQAKLSRQIPTLIRTLVTRKIIEAAATEAGVSVTTEELQEAADHFRLAYKLDKAEDTWSWLQEHYMSLDDFEGVLKDKLLSSKLAQNLFSDQVDSFFYKHQLDYVSVVLYEVILRDADLAMELFYSLKEKEISFHEIARQYIQKPKPRRAGGYRGIVYRADLKPEIAAAVFVATPPQLLEPITTSEGTHLILVEEILKPQLSDETLRSQIHSDLFSSWLQHKISQVEIITKFSEENLPIPGIIQKSAVTNNGTQ